MSKAKTGEAKKAKKSLSEFIEDFKIGSVSFDDVLQGSTRNMEAIADANRTIIDGYSELAKRQYEMLKDFLEQLKDVAGTDAALNDKIKTILDTAKKDVQDLQEMASKTNSEAQGIIKKRTSANIDAWKEVYEEAREKLLKKGGDEAQPAPKKAVAKKKAATRKAAPKRYTKSVDPK